MCSERPEYNDKITVMQGWGPVAFMNGIDIPLLQKLLVHIDQVEVSVDSNYIDFEASHFDF
jgi:hypothetical protein